MDIQKLSNEIATLKRAVKDAATAPLKEKLRKKIALLDQNIKDANIPAKKLAMMLLGAKRKVAAYTQAEFNAVIKRLSNKAEYSFLKGLSKGEIKDDLERHAKNPGWRFKGRSNFKTPTRKDLAADAGLSYSRRKTYYENRSNRSDVTNPAKLKTGGGVDNDLVYFIVDNDDADMLLHENFRKYIDYENLSNGDVLYKMDRRNFERFEDLAYSTSQKYEDAIEEVNSDGTYQMRKGGNLTANDVSRGSWVKHNTTKVLAKVWNVDPTLNMMQLEDIYGNKDKKFRYMKDWSLVNTPTKKLKEIKEEFAQMGKGGGVGEYYVKYDNLQKMWVVYKPNGTPVDEYINKHNAIGIADSLNEKNKMGTGGGVGMYAKKIYDTFEEYIKQAKVGDIIWSGDDVDDFKYVSVNNVQRVLKVGKDSIFVENLNNKHTYETPSKNFPNSVYYLKTIVVGGTKYANGGGVGDENKEMVLNNAQQIEHHAEELENATKKSKHVPAWVVAKIYNASSNISDATHYLEGVNTMPKEHFERIHEEVENHKMETGGGIDSFLNKQMHISKVCKTHGCSTKDYFNAKNKYIQIGDLNDLLKKKVKGGAVGESNFGKSGTGFDNIKYKDSYKGGYDNRGLMLKRTNDISTLGSKLVVGKDDNGKFYWKLMLENGKEHSTKKGFLNKEDAINDYMKQQYSKGGGTGDTCEIFDSKGERAIDKDSIEKLTKCVTALPQTKSDNVNANGTYTSERQELHKKIINKFKKDVVCITKGKPIAVLMGGSPASGKSTFLKKYRPYLLSESLFKVDADEIRAELPEYKGWNATQTHEEAGDIVNTLISDKNIGVPCNFDFIFDGTMSSVKRYNILIHNLRKENYQIESVKNVVSF